MVRIPRGHTSPSKTRMLRSNHCSWCPSGLSDSPSYRNMSSKPVSIYIYMIIWLCQSEVKKRWWWRAEVQTTQHPIGQAWATGWYICMHI